MRFWEKFDKAPSFFFVNSDFGLEIMKRKNLLQPMLTIEAIDDAMYEEIEKLFPVGEDLDEKTVSTVSARFSTLK